LRNTYGFWSLNKAKTENPYRSLYVEDFDQWLTDQNISIKTILPENLQNFIEPILGKAATTFIGEGASYWIFLLIWIVFGLKNGNKSLLVGTPIIANWLTIMIATPVAFQYRYVLGTVVAVPIFFGMLMVSAGSANKEISS
ncbi:MAG: hypothetical protein LUC43_03780, partial [Burkholderiales bacterium]|nr:hypothetical protein [Burkholderiales bacterium]